MEKVVTLKFGEGSFELGYPVTLQIGLLGSAPSVEIQGRLPPAPFISSTYLAWQGAYRSLGGMHPRLKAADFQITHVSYLEECLTKAQAFQEQLNLWMQQASFLKLRDRILLDVRPTEPMRLIIQTQDMHLRRLPWHLWDLFDHFPQAEIALTADYSTTSTSTQKVKSLRILAILGSTDGINVQADLEVLRRLPTAQVTFLEQPRLNQLNDKLWEQAWDILFFAGHSSSLFGDEQGRIYINSTESLTLEQLKFALRTAMNNGLKLAIFNSCDGLGLARYLMELQIPQVIVMREPVPDRVAQTFLKYFLETFAQGQSLYQSVRSAREKLQGLENDYPCATWLPVICQNPAVPSLTWPRSSTLIPKIVRVGIGVLALAGVYVGIRWGWMKQFPTSQSAMTEQISFSEETSLSIQSEPGDYIGQGETHKYKLQDAEWKAQYLYDSTNDVQHISISVSKFDDGAQASWWNINFAAPKGKALEVGTYEDARRYPFQPVNKPGLDFSGSGRGCNTLTGRFTIGALTLGPSNKIVRFLATFEQHCEGASPALRGKVFIVADP